ncbi:putative oxidoreductase [Methylophilus rhizosphaerae]|uniref:Putative oxidoreductase n=1 Tax=Methylophilus rhizosphaerae TaxID=492660 RepID=A0A1G9BRN5_9PROT|nr:DoxX family protein [Methylophilus rhizosphaerae]SDK42128.1 putative oxidoreductase [Methylophilus rhizosphaerae]
MNSWHSLHVKLMQKTRDLGLLALRIWAGQEFILAGYTKLSGGVHAPEWFSGLQFPFPLHFLGADLNWVMAGAGEITFGLALLLGFYSRLAAIGLLFITFVAVYTVHFDLGWSGWNQIETDAGLGFKVPLMLALMLFTILTQGSGRYSIGIKEA